MARREKCAYAAGIIDGEGSIAFGFATVKGKRYPRPVIHVANTNLDLLYWLRDNFGGSIPPTPKDNGATCKPLWRWYIGGFEPTMRFLEGIMPYLVIKKAQAQLVFDFAKTKARGSGHQLTDDMRSRRLELSVQMTALNKRGRRMA